MSTLKVNALNNGGSAIDLPNSFKLSGNPIEQGYTSSATEPTSPNTGDLWWDSTNEKLYQYLNGEFKALNTAPNSEPWYADPSSFSYDSISLSTTGEAAPRSVRLSQDGTRLYFTGSSGDAVREYSLSTAWDMSTATADSVFSVLSQAASANGIDFSYDGTKMYILDAVGIVYQYSLSTAWDSSTASYDSKSFDLNTGNSNANSEHGIALNTDGTKLYVAEYTNDAIFEYELSTAFDISTASYVTSFGTASDFQQLGDIYINPNDDRLYVPDVAADVVREIVMSTPSDLSTASISSATFDYSSVTTGSGLGVHFKPDGTKMYFLDFSNDIIYQFTSGTAT